jgi:D-arabinose 1-dehydrogenase-like Zn-dependent alcohol dehydrogenase
MKNQKPNSTQGNSTPMWERRQFLAAGATMLAAPLLSGVTARGQSRETGAPAAEASPTPTPLGSRKMRALQLTAFRRPLELADLPVAAPGCDGALVRVEACGICRSDWHFWNQDWTWMGLTLPLPTVLGHEVGGIVEEVGSDVRSVKVGDQVTIPFHEADGTCPYCREGLYNLCDHEIIPAIQRSGGWAQSVTITAADLNCIRLPTAVDTLSAAALGCRYMTAYRAVTHQGHVRPGQWLAVHGCGGVGLSAVQIAAAMDAMVVAIDIFDNKLAKARDEGAVVTINARGLSPEKVGQAVKEATGGGVHVSIDALGRAFTVHQSIQSLRKRGRHVQVGLTSQEERGQVALPIDTVVTVEWEIVGSKGNPQPNYAELLALVARKKLNPARLVTRQIALSDVTDTLQRMTRFDTVGFEVITRFT